MGYKPALDGLRALSVVAVIAYHAGLTWIPGGFIGVEVFFVVSGYLITTLLIEERLGNGFVSLKQFWIRRARRLLPALFAMLCASAIAVAFFKPEFAPAFRRDVLAAVLYVSNWWQIFFVSVPYFAPLDPPILRHLWSLAVEEQWYLIWPVIFSAVLCRRSVRLRRCGTIVVLVALAIMLLTSLMYVADDETRINFLYLSTLTRSTGLLCGAGLAFFWRPWAIQPLSIAQRLFTEISCLAGFALLIGVAAYIHVDDALLYRGGLAAATVASCIVIAVVVHPSFTFIKWFVSRPLFVEIGRRSYGLYLWHWPIFVITGARDSINALAVALAATVIVNELSYVLIEQPARRGVIGAWWKRRSQLSNVRRRRFAAIATLIAVGLAVTGVRVAGIEARDLSIDTSNSDVIFVAPTTVPSSSPVGAQTTVPNVSTTSTTIATLPRRVLIVGDSQAHALAINLPSGIEKTFTISDGSIDGCGVYDRGVGIGGDNGNFRRNFVHCAGFEKSWTRSVTKARAQVALVVIGAWEVLDLKVNNFLFKFGTVPADTFFRTQMLRGIKALRDAGATVALLEVACMRPVASKGGPVPPLPQRRDDARTGHLNELMKDIALAGGDNDGIYFVSGPTEWCTDPKIGSSTSYRWDGVHVYKPGAKLIYEAIAATLLQLPVSKK
ncbi:MAG: acyltransferase family protein [Ilumatobacteraceae bacterium]